MIKYRFYFKSHRVHNLLVQVDSSQDSEMLRAAFSQRFIDLGFSIIEEGGDSTATVLIQYESTPLNLENSPYNYESYNLSAIITSGDSLLYSYQKSEREAAMSAEDAAKRALKQATTGAVDEFFTLLSETLGDET